MPLTFDNPGTDQHRTSFTQPNEYARVIHANGIYPAAAPNRTEYYLPISGGTDFNVALTWDRPQECGTITGGIMYTPSQRLLGIPEAHARGLSGAGVKICVLDGGWSGNIGHPAISITESYDPNGEYSGGEVGEEMHNNLHHLHTISIIAARPVIGSHLKGTAFGSEIYAYNLSDAVQSIDRAISQGCKILTISQFWNPDANLAAAFRRFQRAGGVIVISSKNGGSLGAINPLGALPGVICIGDFLGGGVYTFQDTFYSGKIQPVGRERLDFAVPHFTIAAAFDNADGNDNTVGGSDHACYKVIGGTSFGHDVAGMIALQMEEYPNFAANPTRQYILNRKSRHFTDRGVVGNIPNLST